MTLTCCLLPAACCSALNVAGVPGRCSSRNTWRIAASNTFIRSASSSSACASLLSIHCSRVCAACQRARNKSDIDALAQVIGGSVFTFNVRAGEKGKLFGSITASQIADQITKKLGSEFDKRKVALREPIRDVGTYTVPVRLSADIAPTVTVIVQPEGTTQVEQPVVVEASAEAPAEADATVPEAAEPVS